MKDSTPSSGGVNSLEKRMRQEIEAALRCDDARAAAAHVELANHYLIKLSGSRRDGAI